MQAGREVKYRAFVHSVKWVVDVVAIDFSIKEVELDMSGTGDTAYYRFGEVDLLQFTGLRDKNGKEIYEGDIVCDQYANFYTPIFRNGIYMAYNVEYLNLTKQEPSTQFNVVWNNGCEIIGNIYDSPELIAK